MSAAGAGPRMAAGAAQACMLPLGRRCFDGYISCGGRTYRLRLTLPSSGKLSEARLECDWQLQLVLRTWEGVVAQHLSQSRDLAAFLEQLRRTVDGLSRCSTFEPPPPPAFYSTLLSDIGALGWDKIDGVDSSFTNLRIKILDGRQREHFLSLQLLPSYPSTAPVVTADLPVTFHPQWSSEGALVELARQFERELGRFSLLWSQLEELDRQTWRLEPETVVWACTHRRIVVAGSTSLQVGVAPLHPTAVPECTFLGPDHAVRPLRDRWSTGIAAGLWDPEETILANLQSVLGICFPAPPSAEEKEEQEQECSICYAWRLEGAAPDVVCDSEPCGKLFHHACLFEWLKAMPGSRQSFNTVFGECPYCSNTIGVRAGRGQ